MVWPRSHDHYGINSPLCETFRSFNTTQHSLFHVRRYTVPGTACSATSTLQICESAKALSDLIKKPMLIGINSRGFIIHLNLNHHSLTHSAKGARNNHGRRQASAPAVQIVIDVESRDAADIHAEFALGTQRVEMIVPLRPGRRRAATSSRSAPLWSHVCSKTRHLQHLRSTNETPRCRVT